MVITWAVEESVNQYWNALAITGAFTVSKETTEIERLWKGLKLLSLENVGALAVVSAISLLSSIRISQALIC